MTFEEIINSEYKKGVNQGKLDLIRTLLESQTPDKVAELLKISVEEINAFIEK